MEAIHAYVYEVWLDEARLSAQMTRKGFSERNSKSKILLCWTGAQEPPNRGW